MFGNLCKRNVPFKVFGAVSGGDSVQTSSALTLPDGGWGALFNITFGTITLADALAKIYVTASNDNVTFTQLYDKDGTNLSVPIVVGMSAKIVQVEVAAPRHKYLKLVIDRSASSGNSIAIVAASLIVHGNRVNPDPSLGDMYSGTAWADNNTF